MPGEFTNRSDVLTFIFRSDYRWLTDKLRRRISHGTGAEDIASEAFVRLAAIPELLNIREPRAMLTTLAQRVLYENWRRRDLEQAYLKALAGNPQLCHPSPEEQELVIESLLAIDRALDGLSINARKAFLFNQLDGMTYAEIAQELGVSTSMVRKYVAKALTSCYLITAGQHE
ncbi:sigma-70 family RNA polymerase sigma factor [Sodalis sp. C49]|uniref:sigma-70 family RNA polymerase sigma factor n=1 Tax=unclassified Sodalis (in: enterobacteria) TaxID=2636512 RepID=UPI003965AD33